MLWITCTLQFSAYSSHLISSPHLPTPSLKLIDQSFNLHRNSPDKFELTGKTELLIFILTFLTSTWYIKNPFLKSKINDVLFLGIWGYGRERSGVLGTMLNSDKMALKWLMPALMHFYIEVEQTGASSQFYDKFSEWDLCDLLNGLHCVLGGIGD